MLKSILEVLVEATYVFMVLVLLPAFWYHRAKIKDMQRRRQHERKKQLAENDLKYHCSMMYKLYELEKPKQNRQSFTVKGVLAAEYYNQA